VCGANHHDLSQIPSSPLAGIVTVRTEGPDLIASALLGKVAKHVENDAPAETQTTDPAEEATDDGGAEPLDAEEERAWQRACDIGRTYRALTKPLPRHTHREIVAYVAEMLGRKYVKHESQA
jgi:hypothetical protein